MQRLEIAEYRKRLNQALSVSAEERAELRQVIADLGQQLSQAHEEQELQAQQRADLEQVIADLGQRLNQALAARVKELGRSAPVDRLRQILGAYENVRVIGDRISIQTELLFPAASADLTPDGRQRLAKLAPSLREINQKTPRNVPWFLRVDGHTDRQEIGAANFVSNWDLSAARAIAVVRFLIDQGVPENRLAATAFSEFHPVDPIRDESGSRKNRRVELQLTLP